MLNRFFCALCLLTTLLFFAFDASAKDLNPKLVHERLAVYGSVDYDWPEKSKQTLANVLFLYRFDKDTTVYEAVAKKTSADEKFCSATVSGVKKYMNQAGTYNHMYTKQATPVHVRRVSGFFSNACPAVKLALSEIESASIAHAKNHCPIFELGNCWNKHNNLWARDDITIGLYFDFAETASTSQLLEVCEKGALKQKQIAGSELKSRNGKLHSECPYESPFLTQVAFNGN